MHQLHSSLGRTPSPTSLSWVPLAVVIVELHSRASPPVHLRPRRSRNLGEGQISTLYNIKIHSHVHLHTFKYIMHLLALYIWYEFIWIYIQYTFMIIYIRKNICICMHLYAFVCICMHLYAFVLCIYMHLMYMCLYVLWCFMSIPFPHLHRWGALNLHFLCQKG